MRRLILIAALSALVIAKPKPETYRETEDFQYARSSSDDGQKSGYYGAQRGNMGGNYERAHNMDSLAQHQMSGLVRQVDGELGQGANTKTGSVYTAANSRGIYGSGNYDLSNLKGRNFAEGESIGQASQAYSSHQSSQNYGYGGHSYSGMNSAGSSSSLAQNSRYSGYQSLGHADQRQIDNLQALDVSQGLDRYENSNQAGYNTNYHTQYGSQGHSEFDQSNTNLHSSSGYGANAQSSTQGRYITTPVRVVLRPGGRVAIPISAPTYQVSQNVLSEDKNAINADAEILNQQSNFNPTNKAKHYESSYSYRKQWERHHTQPGVVVPAVVVPTENPFGKSELNEDVQLLQSAKDQFQAENLQTAHSSNVNSEHRANSQSVASTRSLSQSAVNTQQSSSGYNAHHESGSSAATHNAYGRRQQSGTASDAYTNAYGHNAQLTGMAADLTNSNNMDLKPKSYHSSYSYHKSWERQGDPYVIKPSGTYDGQASQRLTAASAHNAAYSSHQYGSQSRQAQQSYLADCDCDDEGHVRVARSYNSEPELQQQQQNQWEDLTQQTQNDFERLEDLGQQTQSKWENLENLGQQTQSKWDNLEDLGQQQQNNWDKGNLQDLGQQTQNQWDNLQQLGQQTQNKWDKLEDYGQQTHRDLEQSQNENLEDFSQLSQKEDVLTNFEQQANGNDLASDEKNKTQQSQLNSHNWEQVTRFEPQSNTPTVDNINTQIPSGDNLDESQQNSWYSSHNFNMGENINSNNFMVPISQSKDSEKNFEDVPSNTDKKPNLFPLPLSNNKEDVWGFTHHQNTYNYEKEFSHTNFFNNFNKEFEHHFQSNSFSTNAAGSPLQGLWNKIDNIAGDVSTTVDKSDADKFYAHHYSKFDDFMQNGYSWSDTHPNYQTPQVNTGSIEQNNMGHHNLFDEETQDSSTTVRSNKPFLFEPLPKPTEKSDIPASNQNVQLLHHDKNNNPSDAGRGDIGPEDDVNIAATSKPYKSQDNFDSFSLTKETTISKPDNIGHGSPNQNRQNQFINTPESQVLNTTPTSTTANINGIGKKPVFVVTELHNPHTYVENHKPKEQMEEVVDQENLEQQNFEQIQDLGQQSQTSWFSNDNLQQGYDQQNMEQQFEVLHPYISPYSTPEKIETFDLTKETAVTRVDNRTQLDSMKNKEDSRSTVSTTNSDRPVNANEQFQLISPYQSVSTGRPAIEVSTVSEINNNPLSDGRDHNLKETEEILEPPEDIQQQNLQQYEDFGQQLQNSWYPSDHLQQYDQQNAEQQFEDFQQHERLSDLQNFKQEEQIPDFGDIQSQQPHEQRRVVNNSESQPMINSKEATVQKNDKIVEPKQPSVDPAPPIVETETEKPGFWKSVGSKFSNAKDKVYSWFKRS